jgi:hypothetical protein
MLPERNRRNTGRGRTIRAIGAALALLAGTASADTTSRELDFQGLRPVESGHRSYYELRKDERGTYLHADYQAGDEATKQALVLPESERRGHHKLTWRWRALVLPAGGDECDPAKRDSAASVYVAWRRGLRWYGLKYSWSAVSPVGAVCDRNDTAVMRGETIILRSGGPLGTWMTESIDVEAEFHKHITPSDPIAEVPDLRGFAVLTDGDQTHSESSADYGSFVLTTTP